VDLVYKVDDENFNVVFAERRVALYVRNSMTRCAPIPGPSLGSRFPRAVGKNSSKSSGSEPFDGDYMQTGYPEWLANTEIQWFPEDLIKKYGGSVEHSMASDDSLYLPAEKAEEIAHDLRALGHTVEPSPVDLI
jgi:hypothetical protein